MSFMNFENFILGFLNKESVRNIVFSLVAHRWVAGNNLEDAIERAWHLNLYYDMTAIINHVGEHIVSLEQGEKEREEYFRIIDAIVRYGIKASVSLKPSQLITTKSADDLVKALEPIVKKAQKNNIIVCVDMEDSSCTKMTIDAYKILYDKWDYKNLQIVIQAYMRRTSKDLEGLEKIGAKVRLCKGAYRTESPKVIIKKHEDICKTFASQIEKIFRAEGLNFISIATHDPDIIQKVKSLDKKYPGMNFEFQMLIGVRDKLMRQLAEEGYRVSAYVPYGNNWMPYFIRRIRENKDYLKTALESILFHR